MCPWPVTDHSIVIHTRFILPTSLTSSPHSPHPLIDESGECHGECVLEGLGIPKQLIRVFPAHMVGKLK